MDDERIYADLAAVLREVARYAEELASYTARGQWAPLPTLRWHIPGLADSDDAPPEASR